jgi:hypothetical protein
MPTIPADQIIRAAVSNGVSANAAYRQLRDAAKQLSAETGDHWTGIRRSVFLQIYSQTVSMRAKVDEALTLPKDQLPPESLITNRVTQRTQGYGNWGIVFSRQMGSSDAVAEFYTVTTDSPLTPAELEQRIEDDFRNAQQTKNDSKYRSVFLGASYTGTNRYIRQ